MLPGFDPYDLDMLNASQAAYGICDINSEYAHVLTLNRPDVIIFAFQGTNVQDLEDLITDGDIIHTMAPDLEIVNAGLYRSTCSVAWRLVLIAISAAAAGKRIMVTGHSKGGGEAQLFVAMLIVMGIDVARLTVFEPYRSLGAKAQGIISGVPGLATRNGCDPVPELPLALTQRPLVQLGPSQITLFPLADHGLAAVAKRFTALAAPAVQA